MSFNFFAVPESLIPSLIYVLLSGYATSICASLYLHRSMTHTSVKFVEPISVSMRIWLWLATGMNTQEWVAVHRKHHAYADVIGDPHSPVVEGKAAVVFGGVFLYRKAVKDPELLPQFGKTKPEDWIEKNVFSKFRTGGIFILIATNMLIFGPFWGLVLWLCQALWMIVLGHIINGLGHWIGYKNKKDLKDHSTNILPIAPVGMGEEFHNNHHAEPTSPKFSKRWWEFDPGWTLIVILAFF